MNYFDTDNRKFAKEFVNYGVFSTDDTLPYKASEDSAMGEYVHPLKDIEKLKVTKQQFNRIINKSIENMNKNRISLTESQLQRVIEESVRKVLNESDFHRAFKRGKSLDVLNSHDGTYQDSDIECLAELKEKLHQAEERAKMPQYGSEGKTRNYLVGAIKGLQAFIDSRS